VSELITLTLFRLALMWFGSN